MNTLENILDNPDPTYRGRFQHTIALYNWSTNVEGYNPFQLFLDLIGYTTKHYGQPIFHPVRHRIDSQHHIELDYLADALKEWAIRPHDVEKLITDIIESETND